MPFLILTKNNSNDDNKHNWFFLHGASNINEARQLAVKHILEARFGEDGWADKLSEADAGFYLQKVILIEFSTCENIDVNQAISKKEWNNEH
jgi:hypothetical protein